MAISAGNVSRSGLTRLAGLLTALACISLWAQLPVPGRAADPAAQPAAPKDALGRGSPRGTVLGFLAAARKGRMEVASQYLSTPLRGAAAQELAQKLFIVLDRRLPARLLELSDSPEGSLSTLKPDEDLIGTISSSQGDVDILVERVARPKIGSLWLFSRETMNRIPGLIRHNEVAPINSHPEAARPQESRPMNGSWSKWGPYLSARHWETVREDYFTRGDFSVRQSSHRNQLT
jgi:hypothetical protein